VPQVTPRQYLIVVGFGLAMFLLGVAAGHGL
jgi:hypothetical protein